MKNKVDRDRVKQFAEAIGDISEVYVDQNRLTTLTPNQTIAPPTFPIVLNYGEVEGLIFPNGIIHGEQSFTYHRPLLVGEDVYCSFKVDSYTEKRGSTGRLGFLVLSDQGLDTNGHIIFSSKRLNIITEAVKKEMIR